MNIEIKYRAWDKVDKVMVDWDSLKKAPMYLLNEMDSRIFIQFTGLFDRHGKEIYEGDIVKTDDALLEVIFGLHFVGFDSDCAISAKGNGFHFKWISGGRDFLGTPYMEHLGDEWCEHYLGEEVDWDNGFEVIGNVFENPDLLKSNPT